MEMINFILDTTLLVASGLYILGATVTDDDTKEIKYLLWSILFLIVVCADELVYGGI